MEQEEEEEDAVEHINHDVLMHVFPNCTSLETFLVKEGKFSRQFLIQTGDSPQYIQLLQRAVINAPPVPSDLEFVQRENHLSLLHGLVADLVKAEKQVSGGPRPGRNVLTQGLWNAKSADVNGVRKKKGRKKKKIPFIAIRLMGWGRSNAFGQTLR